MLKVLRGNGDGTFQLPAITQNTRGGSFSSVIADFDNDSKLDIAIINPVFDVVDVYLNSPTAQGAAFNATVFIQATNVLVATFKDYDAAKTAASFSATINWGDSTPSSSGTISANGNGGFNVNGTHTYSTPGPYNVVVQVSDSSGNLANATGTATVGCGPTIVTNTNDTGDGSLRQTILGACPGSTITFAAGLTSGGPATIVLASELVIDKNLTITGPGANLLSVSGNNVTRVLNVQAGTVVISGLAIINGRVSSGVSGAGIVNRGTLALIACTISGNTNANGGGGILNFADSAPATLTIINSTIGGNSASSFGSGLYNTGNGGATLNLINSTVTNNGNGSFGGGIYNSASSGTATLNITNSTIAGNRAGSQGGGIYNFGNNGAGTVNLNNSIVADNSVINTPSDISNFNGNLSGNNNIIESSADHTITGSNNSNVDPLLEKDGGANLVLKSNGGPTKTLLPAPNSPARDNGSNAALPTDAFDLDGDSNTAEPLPVDQRGPGFNRIVNATVDIGAVEINYTITAITGSPQSALINTAFAMQMQARVQESGVNQNGLAVTFAAPPTGASGSFSGSATVNTDASGIAAAPVFTANGTAGGYNVVASLVGGFPSANFSLANLSTISINDVTITEGNAATANLTFTVTLAATSNLTVTVDYATANGTATTTDSDYQSKTGTLTFNPGDLTKTVTVLVNGDQKTEADENLFVVLSNPVNAAFSDSQGTGTILNDDTLQLLLDTSGPDASQLAALDSLLLIRDPFRVQNTATWLTSDPNTRVMLFALNLQLNSGESPSVVKVTLLDGNGQPHEVPADDVRAIPNTSFTQVTFRLPDALAQGTCLVSIKVHERISDTGTFRIVQ